jgi:hypothetical protein
MPTPPEVYLGDTLYASYDGFTLKLRSPNAAGLDHEVFLEPEVLANLLLYIDHITDKAEEKPQ